MDLSKVMESMGVEVPLHVWIVVHAQLCLALRHPDSEGDVRQITRAFTHRLGHELVARGLLTQDELDLAQRDVRIS